MESGFQNPEILIVESRVLGFGIRNTAQGIRNLTSDWNPESGIPPAKESEIQYLESRIYGVDSRIPDCIGFQVA